MKKLALAAALLLGPALPALANPQEMEDVKKAASCPHCGMDRGKFAHSRMVVEYEDGTSVGTCSLRCTAIDMASSFWKEPRAIRVGDASTGKLLDAEKATWVLGGSRPGVMTRRAKWAFETPEAAQAFARESGGTVATFDQAVQAAYEDLHADGKVLRERRRERARKMAEEGAAQGKPAGPKHGDHKH